MRRLKVALDCDISGHLVAVLDELYGHRGFEFTHVSKFTVAQTTDEHWADAFKRFGGHVTVSADERIAYTPHKAIAFIDNGFISFFMNSPWQSMRGHLKAAHLVHAWPDIEVMIRGGGTGRCWRVPCNAKMIDGRYADLRLTPIQLDPLVIPDDVLEQARQTRDARKTLHRDSA